MEIERKQVHKPQRKVDRMRSVAVSHSTSIHSLFSYDSVFYACYLVYQKCCMYFGFSYRKGQPHCVMRFLVSPKAKLIRTHGSFQERNIDIGRSKARHSHTGNYTRLQYIHKFHSCEIIHQCDVTSCFTMNLYYQIF